MFRRKLSSVFFLTCLLFLIVAAAVPLHNIEAQCGTQASSCKNCHEVQGELPVNADGTGWHESHAFGDFCYICHAGNQQATVKEEAHIGIVPPLSDVKASCQMCHAADLDDRAQVYAVALNIDLAAGSGGSASAAPTDAPGSDDFWGSEPAATAVPAAAAGSAETAEVDVTAECPPTAIGGMVVDDASFVDYVQRYDEIVLGKTPTNWGDIVLIGMIGLLIVGGGGFVVWNEVRSTLARAETRKVEGEYPVDVVDMLPALSALQDKPRKALKKILDNPSKTDKVLGLIETVVADDESEERNS